MQEKLVEAYSSKRFMPGNFIGAGSRKVRNSFRNRSREVASSFVVQFRSCFCISIHRKQRLSLNRLGSDSILIFSLGVIKTLTAQFPKQTNSTPEADVEMLHSSSVKALFIWEKHLTCQTRG